MNNNLYFAKGGETVAMSELLLRGYNVAVPAVDVGDDIYVVEDAESNLIRVQVKSSNCRKRRYGYMGQVKLPLAQLRSNKKTKLVYIFALRFEGRWLFVVTSRDRLEEEVELHHIGAKNKKVMWLTFQYNVKENTLLCSGKDFSMYLDWEEYFPSLRP